MFECEVSTQIARLTLNGPPVNALSWPWADAFNRILDDLESRSDWRVLQIRSALRVFSAGGDIKQFAHRIADPRAGDLLAEEAACYQQLFARIETMPQVSLVEIGGVAAGGGLELALACDLRIAADSIQLGLPEVGLGLLPSAGGTQRLTRLCGRGRAMRLIGGAELVTAREALALGVVEWVVQPSELPETAAGIASRLAAQPLEALQLAKRCIAAAFDATKDGYAEEREAPRVLMQTPETRQKIEAFVAKSKR